MLSRTENEYSRETGEVAPANTTQGRSCTCWFGEDPVVTHSSSICPIAAIGSKADVVESGQQPEQRELHDEQNDLRLLVSVVMGRAIGAKHGPIANILPEV